MLNIRIHIYIHKNNRKKIDNFALLAVTGL